MTFKWWQFHKGHLSYQSLKISLNITNLEFPSSLPGANVLISALVYLVISQITHVGMAFCWHVIFPSSGYRCVLVQYLMGASIVGNSVNVIFSALLVKLIVLLTLVSVWLSVGLSNLLPEASFGFRVLSLPASVCVCVSIHASITSLSAQ